MLRCYYCITVLYQEIGLCSVSLCQHAIQNHSLFDLEDKQFKDALNDHRIICVE